jgi:hypothetical protein
LLERYQAAPRKSRENNFYKLSLACRKSRHKVNYLDNKLKNYFYQFIEVIWVVLAYNVSPLVEEADFEAQSCQRKFDTS